MAGSLIEMIFFNAPMMLVGYSAQGTYWVGNRVYRHYYPEVRESDLIKREINKLKFELEQLKNIKWVLINKNIE